MTNAFGAKSTRSNADDVLAMKLPCAAQSATIGSAANDTMPLHSGWKFRQANRNEWHPATVPGVVHTDLMDNGLIEDPYYRLNERALQWIDVED